MTLVGAGTVSAGGGAGACACEVVESEISANAKVIRFIVDDPFGEIREILV
jgi:hypothetical protein